MSNPMDCACCFFEVSFSVLQQLWHTVQDSTSDPTIMSCIIGVESQFQKFSFFFGIHLAQLVHTDNLSKTLQSTAMSVSEGAHIAGMTITTLQALCSDDHFLAFWEVVLKAKQEVEVQDPELPRRRKVPCTFEDGGPGNYPTDCVAHYRQAYFKASDLVVNAVQDRFDQPDFQKYQQLEELLMNTIRGGDTQETLKHVCDFYGQDFDPSQLQLHLETLKATFPENLISPTLSFMM